MGFTSSGLDNGGRTEHYQFSYDDTLSPADGVQRTNAVMSLLDGSPACERDYAWIEEMFNPAGYGYPFSLPISIQIANARGGASWQDPSNLQKAMGFNPTVTVHPQFGSGSSAEFIRYLLVMEVTEMFMSSAQDQWYEPRSFFSGADEGSKGEGLSRFLAYVWLSLLPNYPLKYSSPFNDFFVVGKWLNGGRPNFVDNNPDDNNPDPTTGCTTAFLHYLAWQLGYPPEKIIANGGSTLSDVYGNLTGRNDAWQSFISLVNTFYPAAITYGTAVNPVNDAIFPVPHLRWLEDVQMHSGTTATTNLWLDRNAPTALLISLSSDNPAILQVPSQKFMQQNSDVAPIACSAPLVPGPMRTVGIHASYPGTTVNATVTITPQPSVLEGHVRNTVGNPIDQAIVTLSGSLPITNDFGPLALGTDGTGWYHSPDITPQFYEVNATAEGYVPANNTVTVGLGVPTTRLDFTLAAALKFTVKGKVTFQAGAAVAGATVTLDTQPPSHPQLKTTTDADGDYTITGDPNSLGGRRLDGSVGAYVGGYTLTAAMAGFMPASATFTIPNGATLVENLVIAALGSMSGTVTDLTGKPISGATVTATPTTDAAAAVHGSSGPTGAYSLAGLHPQANDVTVYAGGYDEAHIQVAIPAGGNITQDFALTPGSATVEGSVVDSWNGNPIANATVQVSSSTAQTDDWGGYILTGVGAGDQGAAAMADGFSTEVVPIHLIAHQTLTVGFGLRPLHQKPPPPGPPHPS
jgi:hypothetical protein